MRLARQFQVDAQTLRFWSALVCCSHLLIQLAVQAQQSPANHQGVLT